MAICSCGDNFEYIELQTDNLIPFITKKLNILNTNFSIFLYLGNNKNPDIYDVQQLSQTKNPNPAPINHLNYGL